MFSSSNNESELQKYGHYLAHGVNIHPNFSFVTDKPESELQKYGHYLAHGVKFCVKKTNKFSVLPVMPK